MRQDPICLVRSAEERRRAQATANTALVHALEYVCLEPRGSLDQLCQEGHVCWSCGDLWCGVPHEEFLDVRGLVLLLRFNVEPVVKVP